MFSPFFFFAFISKVKAETAMARGNNTDFLSVSFHFKVLDSLRFGWQSSEAPCREELPSSSCWWHRLKPCVANSEITSPHPRMSYKVWHWRTEHVHWKYPWGTRLGCWHNPQSISGQRKRSGGIIYSHNSLLCSCGGAHTSSKKTIHSRVSPNNLLISDSTDLTDRSLSTEMCFHFQSHHLYRGSIKRYSTVCQGI